MPEFHKFQHILNRRTSATKKTSKRANCIVSVFQGTCFAASATQKKTHTFSCIILLIELSTWRGILPYRLTKGLISILLCIDNIT